MNAAQKVIAKFGGQSALAGLIGKRQSTVQHWAKTGIIPVKWQTMLLDIARQQGLLLTPSDFLPKQDMVVTDNYSLPIARWPGVLIIGEHDELPCYVLSDGRRVISRTGATTMLTGGSGGGNLEHYLATQAVKPYVPDDLPDRMIEFVLPEVSNKTVRGLLADDFLTICKAYVKARDLQMPMTDKQLEIAAKASMLLMACAKVGLIALIDEATGYQYVREQDALQVKLRLYLEEEVRQWERTFPDELWMEFGRLTNWHGAVQSRPKYWGKLVLELIYEYLEPDVIDWLRENRPPPRQGIHWHRYYSANYGLQKLIQHIWMVIGVAKTCFSMYELREKMAIQFGRQPVQLTFFVPPPHMYQIEQISSAKPKARHK
jgi:hypothetical protein